MPRGSTRTHSVRSAAAAGVLLAAIAAAGCSDEARGAETPDPPAVLDEDTASGIPRITLTEQASTRLGIELGAVSGEPDALVVPYDAVMYEPDGSTWVYTRPQPLTYERSEIGVNWIENGLALLDYGPPPGTEVVVVGGAELGGIEEGL